jgi:hypothetical protein
MLKPVREDSVTIEEYVFTTMNAQFKLTFLFSTTVYLNTGQKFQLIKLVIGYQPVGNQ